MSQLRKDGQQVDKTWLGAHRTSFATELPCPRRDTTRHENRIYKATPVLLGSKSCGSMSHWPPLRLREKIVLRTSRMSTSRGRPPRGLCLAGGISGSTMVHCSSVRSEGYTLR